MAEEDINNQEGGGGDGSSAAPSQFAVGDKVEVRSIAAPGRPPVWYEATVVRTLPRVNRYTVEYGSRSVPVPIPVPSPGGNRKKQQEQGLRQTVDLSDMRPLPPTPRGPPPLASTPSKSPGKRGRRPAFRVADAVEAYHKDGWWAGCVTGEAAAAANGGKYRVKLLGCAGEEEELEFLPEDLRVRLDWIDGQWVTPPPPPPPRPQLQLQLEKQHEQPAETAPDPGPFQEGQLLEVSSDEEGFTGAWFLAILVRCPVGTPGTFLIEYCDLRTDDGKDLLREEMDASHIRPLPPKSTGTASAAAAASVTEFKVLDEVDAWTNDAWWVGVVSKVLPGPRYAVYFRQSAEVLEFAGHELRPHWDWIKGEWVRVELDSVGI